MNPTNPRDLAELAARRRAAEIADILRHELGNSAAIDYASRIAKWNSPFADDYRIASEILRNRKAQP